MKELDPPKYVSQEVWNYASGLQKVDGLETTIYFYQLVKENVSKKLTLDEVEDLLHSGGINTKEDAAGLVSVRIARLYEMKVFSMRPTFLQWIHKHLFDGVYQFAGEFRTCDITKKEPILNWNSVEYAPWQTILDNFKYDFENEKCTHYDNHTPENTVKSLAKFISNIWQNHAFMEGNTRTVAVFLSKYLRKLGILYDISQFADNALYFRNALVRANFSDYTHSIREDICFLEKFFENLVCNKNHVLDNKNIVCHSLISYNEDESSNLSCDSIIRRM